MDIILREATEADLPSLLTLYSRLGQDDGTVLSLEEATRILARMKTYPDYRIYVACIAQKIVGTFALLIMDNLGHKGARSAVLEDVVVDERLRGRGVGRQMMASAHGLCREKGCYKMALTSNRNREDAHRFYESLGFEKHGYSFSISSATTAIPALSEQPESLKLLTSL
jgi:GNAT superfamily N-acetyltransferase